MTNEAIFYLVGCFLGFVIGYSVKTLKTKQQSIVVIVKEKDDEQRKAD